MSLRVKRQDYHRLCDHTNPAQCHAAGPDEHCDYWHTVPAWHVWDDDLNDYATGTGPAQFPRRRDADRWVTQGTETAP
jgi:hypothetical protein